MNKAFLAFSHAKMHANNGDIPIVSTGSWGCNSYGGDKLHKFLQQIVAAKAAGIKLAYSAYQDDDLANRYKKVYETLVSKQIKVCDLWDTMLKFKGFDADSFHEYMKDTLGIEWD